MSKNFESFREFLDSLCFSFGAICLPETWCQPHETSDSNLQISGYVSLHQTTNNQRGGGLCIFLLETLSYKIRDDLAVNSSAIERLCVEVFNKKSENIVLNLTYRLPNGDPNELGNHFKNILSKQELTVNKSARYKEQSYCAIDHIITNSVINAEFKTGIIKTDISDHFPIFFIFKCVVDTTEAREEFIYKLLR